MCGIVGILAPRGRPADRAGLAAALGVLRHRGPDGDGSYFADELGIALGNTRLAVVDPAGGRQPVVAEGGQLVLVWNGELYDFERIRADLQARGHAFSTASDAEVVLHLYQEQGLGALEELRGEFAFVLLDRRAGRLLAARDRFGVKPLYYAATGAGLVLASEIKALAATGLVSGDLDLVALRDGLCGQKPASYFAGVEALPPGHVLEAAPGGWFQVRRYGGVPPAPRGAASVGEAAARVREALEEAVRLRLRADVPVGLFLSGGVDSASVAAIARGIHGGPLPAFTLAFADDGRFDEGRVSAQTARELGLDLHLATVRFEALAAHLEACVWHVEQPFINLHTVGRFLLSRLASQHVRVVLTGEGADELFFGYASFGEEADGLTRQATRAGPPAGPLRSAAAAELRARLGFVPDPAVAEGLEEDRLAFVHSLFHPDRRSILEATGPWARLEKTIDRPRTDGRTLAEQRQLYVLGATLPHYILPALGDRVEMAHGVEGRQPFLDDRVARAAGAIPAELHRLGGTPKHVLREAMRGVVPERARLAPKEMFAAPPADFLRAGSPAARALIREHLAPHAVQEAGIFDPRRVAQLLEVHQPDEPGRPCLAGLITYLLTTQILHRRFHGRG